MAYKLLFIWVEGNDDEVFFRNIVKPTLEVQHEEILIRKYASEKKEKIDSFIRSIDSMPYADYIFVADINSAPCITERKQVIKQQIPRVNLNKVVIVIKEIESWYFAGLDYQGCKRLKAPITDSTNSLTKEMFNKSRPNRFDSRLDYMLEILKFFSIDVAREKNESLNYFVEKYVFNVN